MNAVVKPSKDIEDIEIDVEEDNAPVILEVAKPALDIVQQEAVEVIIQQPVKQLECSACGQILSSISNLNRHELGHKSREYICSADIHVKRKRLCKGM